MNLNVSIPLLGAYYVYSLTPEPNVVSKSAYCCVQPRRAWIDGNRKLLIFGDVDVVHFWQAIGKQRGTELSKYLINIWRSSFVLLVEYFI